MAEQASDRPASSGGPSAAEGQGAAEKRDAREGAGEPQRESFDRVLGRLRTVVERLETGELGLEESLRHFEEGIRLSRRGAEILDAAERRVEMLLRGNGGERVVELAPAEPKPGEP